MKRFAYSVITFLLLISLAGCQGSGHNLSDYDDEDIAAIVNGQEITIGDLRFMYEDEKVIGNIEGAVKLELLLQEAKEMKVDVSKDIASQQEMLLQLPQHENDSLRESIQVFITSQAKKLGMNAEDYYSKYVERRSEQIAYIHAYVRETFGDPDSFDEVELKEFDKKNNDYLNELMEKHSDQIEILIK
ncbi:hypothetical protein [Sporosarcina sp. ITBMC105]